MISRVIRSKGVLEFMAAARVARLDHPHARFLLIGTLDDDSVDRLSPKELEHFHRQIWSSLDDTRTRAGIVPGGSWMHESETEETGTDTKDGDSLETRIQWTQTKGFEMEVDEKDDTRKIIVLRPGF